MNLLLDTNAAVNTFCPMSKIPSFGDILTDALLAAVFSVAPCSVCSANDLPTVGPTFFDSETGGQFCLGCLELACEPLEDGPEDAVFVETGRAVIAARRAA